MIGQTVSHYRIIERIGTGGMGAVYKAEDTRLGVNVVLKFLHAGLIEDERAKKRFIHEAQAASALDHPNICAVHGIDETADGQLFIAMRYYEGESLKERIAARAPLSVRESFQIAFSIAQGLSAAHRSGVTHRDIKPANAVITNDGFVKILDFGLAKVAGRTALTASDTTLGTVSYMSPEQAGARDVDTRTDIWSLGVVLYEMLTGKLPFKGDIDQAMVYSILSLPHIPVRETNPDVPDECAAIVDKCLEKDPDLRYQTTDELIDAIVSLSKELGWGSSIAVGSVVPVSNIMPRARRRRPHPRLAVAAVALIAAVTTAAWWFMIREPSPYTTRLRLAVMPIENMAGVELDPLADGVSEVCSDILETLSLQHESMWVLPYSRVTQADLAEPEEAHFTFGVNMLVRGTLQQFGAHKRITLDLCDAATMEAHSSVFINFLPDNVASISDSLAVRLAKLVGYSAPPPSVEGHWPNATAMTPFIYGSGYLSRRDTPEYLENAIDSLRETATRDPSFAQGLALLATACYFEYRRTSDKQMSTEADTLARRAVALTPEIYHPYALAGWVLTQGRRWGDAIDAYQKALDLTPGNPIVSRRLARIYEREDRIDESESVLESSSLHYPDLYTTQRSLGLFYQRNQRIDEAVAAYNRALALAPSDVLTLNNLGSIRYENGEWARARELFERAFRIAPNCDTSSNVGLLLFFERRYEESASYYQFSFGYCDSTAPDYHEQWGNWAKALYWTGEHEDQCRRAFERATQLAEKELKNNPDDSDVIAQLIEYYYYIDDRDNTMRMIDYGRRVAPNDKDVLFSMANAFEKFGDRELALRYAGDSVRHGYSVPEILNTPLLSDLVKDERFKQMIKSELPSTTSQ